MKKTYNLTILNQNFTIKSDADEKHVKKVADYVNKKMHEIVSHDQAVATANVAILAALNIADDFFRLKKQKSEQVQSWSHQIETIIDRVQKEFV
ncbi:cell division protein ZapA [bacterium]|nr:cell division protein ZapA [bacterium]